MTCAPRRLDTAARRLMEAQTVAPAPVRARSDSTARRLRLSHDTEGPRAILCIDRPGTYRLAADVVGAPGTVGILISADHVTLDLAGFSVVGVSGSEAGIRAAGARTNICVRNGTIRGWGQVGADLAGASESLLQNLRLTENAGDGARLGANSTAVHIESWSNSGDGLAAADGAALHHCTARANTGAGFRLGDCAQAHACTAAANARDGLCAGAAAVVSHCVSRHNQGAGILVGNLAAVRSCDLIRNEAQALRAGDSCTLVENRCLAHTGSPAIAAGAGCALDGNLTPGTGQTAAA